MDSQENCQIARPIQADDLNIKRLESDVAALYRQERKFLSAENTPALGRKVIGMKCPDALKNFRAVHRLSMHSPHCRFIVGIRHPVLILQSFYNYRITAMYDNGVADANKPIPPLEIVLDSPVPWQDVSLDTVRFEFYLVQFAKTAIQLELLQELQTQDWLAIKPNKFQIFLYTIDQLEDDNEQRQASFRMELERFLGLSKPLPAFGRENVNRFVGEKAHPETMDICQDQYKGVRHRVLENAKKSQAYIRDFVKSVDVTVANQQHFLATIDSWSRDPCFNLTK